MKSIPVLPVQIVLLFLFVAVVVTPDALAVQRTDSVAHAPLVFSSLWNIPNLYENHSNSILQEFDLIGRYHGQYWWADSAGQAHESWENRRMYFGFNTKVFKNLTLEAQISLNDDLNPVYKGLYDAFIQWESLTGDLAVSIGRLDYVYTGMERSTSSKKIKTMERALLVNQVMPGEVVGIYVQDKYRDFSFQVGLFTGSIEKELTSFEGGFGALLGLSYEAPFFFTSGYLHLDYLYNNGNEANNAFKPYGHVISLWHTGQKGDWGLGTDLTAASGVDNQGDVFGLTLLPTYDFAHDTVVEGDVWQLALRYHFATSSDEYGLKFNKRYEQPVTSGQGDAYSSLYLGLNYYLYQQKLKLMGGMEYFTMNVVAAEDNSEPDRVGRRVEGWSIISGVRLYF